MFRDNREPGRRRLPLRKSLSMTLAVAVPVGGGLGVNALLDACTTVIRPTVTVTEASSSASVGGSTGEVPSPSPTALPSLVEPSSTRTVTVAPASSSAPVSSEAPSPSAVPSISESNLPVNSCVGDTASEAIASQRPLAGPQEFKIDSKNGVVFAVDRNDPTATATITLPDGETDTLGGIGAKGKLPTYVAGYVGSGDSPVTIAFRGSAWATCEQPGTANQSEKSIITGDVGSRVTDFNSHGFSNITGSVETVS